MSGRLDELTGLLTEELEITGKLLDLAKDVRAAVITVDPDLLARILEEQEVCSARLEELESRRVALAVEFGAELGLQAAEPPKLKAIIERTPQEGGLRLRSLGRRLKAAAKQLREVGQHNGELLGEAMAHVDDFFSVLARACRQSAGYRPDGQERESHAATVLDRQI